MAVFEINGGGKLEGEVQLSGAKNAALPIMASKLLIEMRQLAPECWLIS